MATKTTLFNLIILDESGSMYCAAKSTIEGCNNVIDTARKLQKENAEKQDSFMSIFVFDDDMQHSRYLMRNKRVEEVEHITSKDYQPDGSTPLLDAVGSTLIDLKAVADTHEDALGIVTIITDGMENSSREFTSRQVAELVKELRDREWIINLIGANIDIDKVGDELCIDNRMAWKNDAEGTSKMFSAYADCICAEQMERSSFENPDMSIEERKASRRARKSNFFKR